METAEAAAEVEEAPAECVEAVEAVAEVEEAPAECVEAVEAAAEVTEAPAEAKEETPVKEEKTAKDRAFTVLGVILCLILAPILIANITMIVKSYTDSDKVPSFGGYCPFIVLTDSMVPTINGGDLVIDKVVTDAAEIPSISAFLVQKSIEKIVFMLYNDYGLVMLSVSLRWAISAGYCLDRCTPGSVLRSRIFR